MRNTNHEANKMLLIACGAFLLLVMLANAAVDRYNDSHRPTIIVNAEILTK